MKKHSPLEKEIWISGINPVREALRSEDLVSRELILARSDPRGRELEELAQSRGIPISRGSREGLNELAGHAHHQGVALRIPEYPYAVFEDLLEKPVPERDPLLILDSIQDPQNLGAMLRSACFLGARGVIIPKDRSAGVTATVIKIAAGATSYIPVAQVTNLARALRQLKEVGFWIAGLDMAGSKNIFEVDLTIPLCLIVGNEQKGIRPLIRSECDLLVRIPASGPIESLNAASAATVALAEVQRQRFSSVK
jgi:23S rRNA (guanosine2251-2'-O)-methyltransferase